MRDTDYIPAATVEEIGRQEDILYERMVTLARAARRSRAAKREYERVRAAYLRASDLREYMEVGGR